MNEFAQVAGHRPGWDWCGVGVSVACGVHCMVTPVVLAVLPAVGGVMGSRWVHTGLGFVLVPVALWAFWRGLRRHGRLRATVIGGLGATVLMTLLASEWNVCCKEELGWWRATVSVVGSAMLVSGHLLNLRDGRCGCEE